MKTLKSLFRRKIRYHITVVTGALVIISVMAITTVSMILSVFRDSAQDLAEKIFENASLTAMERTESLLQPAFNLARMAAFLPGINTPPVSETGIDHPATLFFIEMLHEYSAFYSVYIALSDGSFFQVINADNRPQVKEAHGAPDATEIILRNIMRNTGTEIQVFTFIDAEGTILGIKKDTDFDYDPRARTWYQEAFKYDDAVLSNPYVFNSLKKPGITVSDRIKDASGVIGVDLTISSLSSFIEEQKVSPDSGIALFTDDKVEVASSPLIKQYFSLKDEKKKQINSDRLFNNPETVVIGRTLFHSAIWDISVNRKLIFISAAPVENFMRGAFVLQKKILLFSILILLFTVPIVVILSKKLSLALQELTEDAEKIGQLNFEGKLEIETPIYEFNKLACGFEVMKATISERSAVLHKTLTKLEMLVDMGIAMSAEFDIDKLSEMILSGAKKLTHADGGSLYLLDQSEKQLEFRIVLNDSLGFCQGGTSGSPVTLPPVQLYDSSGNENHLNVVTHTFFTQKTVNIPDAYNSGKYDFSGTKEFDLSNNYKSVSFLTVPLKLRGSNKVLGALQLLNAKDPETGEIISFPEEIHGFVEALSSAASVAIQNWNLLERQKKLFDDLVRFVASAIDAKSPYTARHCARVPEIARLLIKKAADSTLPCFRGFTLTDSQLREFETAAWLHDCGKVTTPEYVVDKATKLETIYNRIHEIRTRFEVLLRDARIEKLESILAGKDPAEAGAVFCEKEEQLKEDFAFVAECNIGSEYMGDESLERLKRIALTQWYRYFDNRLGLSWSESERHNSVGGASADDDLPVREYLISDRREQVIVRENWTQESYDRYGFKFTVPEYLYNRGELYNLSVRKGTLTSEERFKIDEHVAQTIIMLEKLPFSDDLRMVPQYAGRHHETPDGAGYPRKLKSSELSIPEKILAVADIFEALTSVDRPYKKDKKLSEVIEIMYIMKVDGHIDPDIFDLLLHSGVYREYGKKFLKPEQIDDVDVLKYFSTGDV